MIEQLRILVFLNKHPRRASPAVCTCGTSSTDMPGEKLYAIPIIHLSIYQ